MRRDDTVFIMGEEVARYNGAYKVRQNLAGSSTGWVLMSLVAAMQITKGLMDKFGEDRVVDVRRVVEP